MRCRLIKRGFLAIVLSAATTIVVAWACALWIDSPKIDGWTMYTPYDEPPSLFDRIVIQRAAIRSIIRGNDEESDFLNVWVARSEELDPGMTYVSDARGWPFLCMRGGFDINSPDGGGIIVETHWAIVLDVRPQIPGRDKTITPILPLQPIWSGFVLNTLIYAFLWWVLLTAPLVAKRAIRKSRGHCLECGYDLRGTDHNVCPECGITPERASS